MIILWTCILFLSGSCMFSYGLGRIAKHNIKEVGDGNPGGLNLVKAAGLPLGIVGIALDFGKGYVPLLWLTRGGSFQGYAIVLAGAAPVLGHMFSPFLKGKGGKAIAVTFGVWSALTGFHASLALAVILAVLMMTGRLLSQGKSSADADGFQVVLGMLLLSVFLVWRGYSGALFTVWLVHSLLILYAHRRELTSFVRRKLSRSERSDDHYSA